MSTFFCKLHCIFNILYLSHNELLFYFSSYAASVGAKHYHSSAKLNKGIEELFLDLSKSKLTWEHYITETVAFDVNTLLNIQLHTHIILEPH